MAGSGASDPSIQVPTIKRSELGSNVWGGGPTGVLVYMKGPWVAGVLANNVWSFGGTSGVAAPSYNTFLTQPFVELQFRRGLVCRHRAHHHRELAGDRRQGLDAAGRRAGRPGDQDRRQAAGELAARRLLQCAAAGIRLDLATADAGHRSSSELDFARAMTLRAVIDCQGGRQATSSRQPMRSAEPFCVVPVDYRATAAVTGTSS